MALDFKYRIHEVAKDFGMTSKDISQILTDYATTPKNHMQVLEDAELDLIFEYLTQHHQVGSIAEIFAPEPEEKKAPAKAPEEKKPDAPAQEKTAGSAPEWSGAVSPLNIRQGDVESTIGTAGPGIRTSTTATRTTTTRATKARLLPSA